MSPFSFELACMRRSRGAWLALALACFLPLGVAFMMALLRGWPAGHEWRVRIGLTSGCVLAAMAQAALLPFIQMYLLGDSLAGQASDRRLRTLLVCPVSYRSLYLGKLAAAGVFSGVVIALSAVLFVLAGLLAAAGTPSWGILAGRAYAQGVPMAVLMWLAAQGALTAFISLVFSLAPSFKSGLLGAAALVAVLLVSQLAAAYAQDGKYAWLGHWLLTYHYASAYGLENLVHASTGELPASRPYWTTLASLAGDMIVFAGLGFVAFRRREV